MNLYPEQEQFVKDDSKEVAFIGGRQSGKTTALCRKVAYDAQMGRCVIVVLHNSGYSDLVFREIKDAIRGQFSKLTKRHLSLQHGGDVRIVSSLKDINGHFDVIAFDEPQFLPQDLVDILPLDARVYAVGTSPKLTIFNDTYVASTTDNPVVDPSFVDTVARREECLLYDKMNGHKVYGDRCLKCGKKGLEEESPFTPLYNIGMFINTPCQ